MLQAREFKANPLPSPTADILPPKQTKPPTKPEPFHLDTDCRLNRSDDRKKQVLIFNRILQYLLGTNIYGFSCVKKNPTNSYLPLGHEIK